MPVLAAESGVVGCFAPDGDSKVARLRAAFAESSAAHEYDDGTLAVAWVDASVETGEGELVVVDGDADAARAARRAPAAYAPGDEIWLERPFSGIDWNTSRRCGALICDPSGARQIYLLEEDRRLLFASSLPLLLRAAARPPTPDYPALAEWLAVRALGIGRTLYERVIIVPSAHRIQIDACGWRAERYWRPRPRPDLTVGDQDAAARLRHAVLETVDRAAGSAASPAVLLSGGLDSGSVISSAAHTARERGSAVPTSFTGVFPDYPELDESHYIDAVQATSHVANVKVPLAAGELASGASAYLAATGRPADYPGGLTFRPVSLAAAARGHDRLLDGEGGDELFGCEPLLIVDRLIGGRPVAAAHALRELPGMGDRVRSRALKVVMRSWLLPQILPRQLAALVSPARDDRPEWLRAPLPRPKVGEPWHRSLPLWRSRMEWLLTMRRDAMGVHQHLRGMERIGGVPIAHPFLTASMTEVVLGLPPEQAFDRYDDRALLRTAMEGILAEAVRRRPDKTYFNAPVLDSLTNQHRDVIEARLRRSSRLAPFVDTDSLRAAFDAGPMAHPSGAWRWAREVWRAYAADEWLASVEA